MSVRETSNVDIHLECKYTSTLTPPPHYTTLLASTTNNKQHNEQ